MLQILNFEGLIPIFGGICGILVSYGPIHLNEKKSAGLSLSKRQENKRKLRVLGSLVIIYGLLQLFEFI